MTAPHMRIAKLGVQAGNRFTGRIGGASAGIIAHSLRSGDCFVDPGDRCLVQPALEMLGRRRNERLVGSDG
jgi:hypothetical protein